MFFAGQVCLMHTAGGKWDSWDCGNSINDALITDCTQCQQVCDSVTDFNLS